MSTTNNYKGWKDIKDELKSIGGTHLLRIVRELTKLHIKRTIHLNKIAFYKRCKKEGIIPKGFRIKLSTQECKKSDLLKSKTILEQKRLNAEINSSYAFIKHSEADVIKYEQTLDRYASHLFPNIMHLINMQKDRENTRTKDRQIKKFKSLHQEKVNQESKEIHRLLNIVPKCVENRSSKEFSEAELATLSLGLNYALPDRSIETGTLETIMCVEKILGEIDEKEVDVITKDKIRNEVSHALKTFLNKERLHPKVPKRIASSIASLKQNTDIVITKADKGNMTVVLDRTEYDEKIETLIAEGPYEEIDFNPIEPYEKKIKQVLLDLSRAKKLEKHTYSYIRPDSKKCPILYGLPKIHKPGMPMRPIVDYRYTPGYYLSIFLKAILKFIISDHESTLKNSYEFVDKIKDLIVGQMETLVSYDVVSLFTNVPVDVSIKIALDLLQRNTEWTSCADNLTLGDVSTLLYLVSENFITWRGKFYRQTKGTPMGSPLSAILAEIYLQNMENQLLLSIPHIKFWVRSVDDVFAIVRKRKENDILSILNNFHTDINFTMELESENSINFLDVTITRKPNGSLGRKVYRKPTHTNRYLDWTSHHHRSQKVSVIDSQTVRALRICDEDSLQSELDFVESVLISNGYPRNIVHKRMTTIVDRQSQNSTKDPTEDRKWVAIPYIGIVTYQVAGIVRKNLNRDLGFFTGFKLSRSLNNFKDSAPRMLAGVYEIPCDCGMVYVGESKDVDRRKGEHAADLRNNRTAQSALAEHKDMNSNHNFNIDCTVILCYESRWFQRTFKEAIFIQKRPNNINRNTGLDITPWIPLALDLI